MTKLTELNDGGATDAEIAAWKESHKPSDPMPEAIKKGIMRQAIEQVKKTHQWIAELKNEGIIK